MSSMTFTFGEGITILSLIVTAAFSFATLRSQGKALEEALHEQDKKSNELFTKIDINMARWGERVENLEDRTLRLEVATTPRRVVRSRTRKVGK